MNTKEPKRDEAQMLPAGKEVLYSHAGLSSKESRYQALCIRAKMPGTMAIVKPQRAVQDTLLFITKSGNCSIGYAFLYPITG